METVHGVIRTLHEAGRELVKGKGKFRGWWPDEIYSRPFKRSDYKWISTYEPGGDMRGKLLLDLPRTTPDEIINRLDHSLNSQGMDTAGRLHREYWTTTGIIPQSAKDLAAGIIRAWRDIEDGNAYPDWWVEDWLASYRGKPGRGW